MTTFDFNQIEEYCEKGSNGGKFSFFKLAEDKWQAKVRFLYGPGESFKGYVVHNVSADPMKPKFIPCLRELGQPLESCPLCQAGSATNIQFYIPLYVISMTKVINGQRQAEEPVNQIMIFQRGKTFKGALDSAIRQSAGTPLVSNVFNVVRDGKNNDPATKYYIEFISRDDTTLESIGERPEVEGTYILPNVTFEDMHKYLPNQNMPSGVMPRTVAANNPNNAPFGNYNAPAANNYNPAANMYPQNNVGYQAPTVAPNIPF